MLIIAFVMAGVLTGTSLAATENQYQLALEYVHQGKLVQASSILESLTKKYPENSRYRFDYIHVLGLSGKDQQVVGYLSQLDAEHTPAYVLESIARSARNLRKFDISRHFYTLAAKKTPERLTPKVGLALLGIDQGDVESAIRTLLCLEQLHPDNSDVLYALAYAFETSGDLFQQLRIYEKILRLKPGDPDISRRQILAINRLGANTIAIEKARNRDGLLSKEQWARLKWDQAAYQVRWGEIASENEAIRFEETDAAIETLRANLDYASHLPKDQQIWADRTRFDLIVALRDRREMEEVIEQAEILEKHGSEIPAYSMVAIGDAHLYLEHPEIAIDWYRKALEKDPKMFNAELSLFYAYIEAEEHDKALALIDRMAGEQTEFRRQWVDQGKRALTKENPRKTEIEVTAALARAFGNDLAEAQKRFDSMSANAPFNANLRGEKADVYYLRGWPRLAEKEYRSGLNIDPKDLGLRVGSARNDLELRRYREAEKSISELVSLYGDEKSVQKQNRFWQIHNYRELQLDVRGGISTGSIQGSDTLTFDQHLYSAPIDYNYRVFLHTLWNKTTFPEGIGRFGHYGLGVEYRVPNLVAAAEIHDNDYTRNRIGGSLFASYDLDDYWNVSGSLQSFSEETPYRALKNDVFAESVGLAVAYRVSESRRFDGGGSFLNFSDGNKRFSLSTSYLERWITSPSYILNTTLNLFYSHNTKTNTPYFNPKNGVSVAITFDNDWLTWRRYDKSFHQRLALTGAGYWQDGFGVAPIGTLLYEHRWTANYTIDLAYGAALSSRIYDGDRQTDFEYYLTLNWRF